MKCPECERGMRREVPYFYCCKCKKLFKKNGLEVGEYDVEKEGCFKDKCKCGSWKSIKSKRCRKCLNDHTSGSLGHLHKKSKAELNSFTKPEANNG